MKIDTASLKAMADMVCTMTNEVTVVPSETCWEMCAVDPSHVGMIRFKLNATAFGETYEVGETFRMDMSKLQAILKDMGAETELTITAERMTLKSEGVTRRFTLLSYDPTAPIISFPADRLNLSSYAIFDPTELKARIPSLCAIGSDSKNYIAVKVAEEEGITYSAESNNEDMAVVFSTEKCKVVSGQAYGTYPVGFIGTVFKVIPKGVSLQCMLDDNMPMMLKFICDEYSAEFMLAPIIDSDED